MTKYHPSIRINESSAVSTTDKLYSCDGPFGNDQIHELNKFTGDIVSSVTITTVIGLPGTYLGCTGLTQDPTDGIWYAIAETTESSTNGSSRYIVTIDPIFGVISSIGTIDDAYATLAFTSNGTLYAMGDAGSSVPNVLDLVNKGTGSVSSICTLPSSSNKISHLTYHWDDEIMYRIAGADSKFRFDVINNLSDCSATSVPIIGSRSGAGDVIQFSYNTNDLVFYALVKDGTNFSYHKLTDAGVSSLLGSPSYPKPPKGLSFELALSVDTDGDEVIDDNDNCVDVYNPDQADADRDGIGDVCDFVPFAVVTADVTSGDILLDVSFTCNSATGNEPLTYSWDFDGDRVEDSTEQNPTNTFTIGGDFDVTCTVTDADGDSSSDAVAITTVNPSLRDQKFEQITILESLIDDAPKKTQKELKKAIKSINESLDERLWKDDILL